MTRWITGTLLVTSLISVLLGGPALADTGASVSARVTWVIVPFQSLSVAGGKPNGASVTDHVVLGQPTASDLTRGYMERTAALVLEARSNIPWTVKVQALETDMGRSTDGSVSKPLSDFQLRANDGAYVTLSPFARTLASGEPGSQTLSVDYRVSVDPETYRPGDYGVTLLYTITGD